MNRIYATLLSIPLLFGCVGKSIDSIDAKVESMPAVLIQSETSQLPPCSGVPDIQKLFSIYSHQKDYIDKRGVVGYPTIERTYRTAEEAMESARNALSMCERMGDRTLYIIANHYASDAVSWMLETRTRADEPILFNISDEF